MRSIRRIVAVGAAALLSPPIPSHAIHTNKHCLTRAQPPIHAYKLIEQLPLLRRWTIVRVVVPSSTRTSLLHLSEGA